MSVVVEHRFYKTVAAESSDISDYVIADGDSFVIKEMGGDANGPSSNACIIWDPDTANEVIYATSYSSVQHSERKFTGDAVKKLRIHLINDDVSAATMGAYVIGHQG